MLLIFLSVKGKCNFTKFDATYKSGFEMKKILALGDSYTIGEAILREGSFPFQLAGLLNAAGLNFDVPEIIAQTGWTTDELISAIEKKQVSGYFDIITLLIGVNNQYRGGDLSTYEKEFIQLLNTALSLKTEICFVYVLSIPDWGVTPFAEERDRKKIAKEIDAFNKINLQISLDHQVQYIEITEGTREASIDLSLIAADGLHPSEKEYSRWAKRIADHFLAVQQ